MKRIVSGLLCLLPVLAVAQQPSTDFFRYQRVHGSDGLCLLVREDGTFHLEKDSGRQSTPFEGTLTTDQLTSLRGLTADPELIALRQSDISSEMIVSEIEAMQLSVNRRAGWDELSFPTQGSIRSHRKLLEPFVKWANGAARNGLQKLPQQSVTRCMPKEDVTAAAPVLRVDATAAPAAAKGSRTPRPFLFRLSRDHVYQRTAERMCVVVYPNGRYHLEQRIQDVYGSPRTKVYEGSLGAPSVEEAQGLLSKPELVQAVSPESQNDVWMGEGEIITCSIPRDGTIQLLRFHRFFNVVAFGKQAEEPGAKAGLRYQLKDPKVLDPLARWVKEQIEKQKQEPLDGVAGNDCFPDPTLGQRP